MSHTSPHPQGPQLPTEICEEIISSLDTCFDQSTLWACALVCRSWLPRSRVQLYQSARVGGERIHKFLDMVMMYPHLGVNVKQLDLEKYREDSTDIYRFFSDIIPLLPNITSLSYDSLPIPYFHLPLFSSGLPSLISLTLWNIKADSFGDFVRFVSFHKHLKELTIWGCSWERSSVHHYRFGGVFDILRWLGRMATMKAIRLDLGSAIAGAGDAKEAVVSSLTAYIRFCPNLHTVKLDISGDRLWVLRQLPAVLSGLVSLRRIIFWFGIVQKAEVVLLDDNEEAWTTLDEDLGDSAKFTFLEYVEVLLLEGSRTEVPPWWEYDTCTESSEDGGSDSGRESDGEDGEVECREGCSSLAIESLTGEKGKQRKGIPWGAELTSYDLASLHRAMNHVADFHRYKKPLTDIFPRLSERGVLWCGISNGIRTYALHITASNLVGMKSRNWRPRYCGSLFDQAVDYD
ncbi:hypothetical protein NLI96_g7987 [Meripilus lineatus]|uniref:F-box domain-containing protein n=1 Tax=Meripilus lineatus TaxID=2056292 RepID=A0AAD5UY60_9APHY|nr:hypothetical protein NLI96_g7987 [Physisporinus lineatus]